MDYLKRRLAPITTATFAEIDERAGEVVRAELSARKLLNVDGPHGFEKTTIQTGSEKVLQKETDKTVGTATYGADAFIEGRATFELSRWELDNIERGKQDADLDALEEAAERLALFEENAVMNGYERADMKGLVEYAKKARTITADAEELLTGIAQGMIALEDAYAEKPYGLFVGDDVYAALNQAHYGVLLRKMVEEMIDGPVVRSKALKGALLVPYDHEDLRLYIGQDYAVGYEKHDSEIVTLYLTVSFRFKCYDEDLISRFEFQED